MHYSQPKNQRSFFFLLSVFFLCFEPRMEVLAGSITKGVQSSGASYEISMPSSWNGDLVIYAHGYVAFNKPVAVPNDALPGGTTVADIVNGLGYAYAASSYRENGLAVLDGIRDSVDLVSVFKSTVGTPGRVFIFGVSEGGLVAVKALEQYPDVFCGGLVLCGPIGNFRAQVNYIADFRALYDCYFPGVLPGNAITVPDSVISSWYKYYEPAALYAVAAQPRSGRELLRVARAAFDPADESTLYETVQGLLWYQVYATEDAERKLGGQPYDNTKRLYTGSANDALLNQKVFRTSADPQALAALQAYQTTGKLRVPLVTMHTTGDEIVPYWHQTKYTSKVKASGSSSCYYAIAINRYGHCNVTASEIMSGFIILLHKTQAPLQRQSGTSSKLSPELRKKLNGWKGKKLFR